MNLAGLFDPTPLSHGDSYPYVLVFALGEYTGPEREWLVEQAVQLVQPDWEDATLEVVKVYTGPMGSDRYQAEGESYAWCVTVWGDIWPEWQDELDLAELRELRGPAIVDADGCQGCGENPCTQGCPGEELLPDWEAKVAADPARFWCAPLGPFPGTIVELKVTYPQDERSA